MRTKKAALLAALAVILLTITAGTLAYLTDTSKTVQNTFTVGQVKIKLTESTYDYKMEPGVPIDKDPVVTVEKGSLASWLFIEVAESEEASLSEYIKYKIKTGERENEWHELKEASVPDNVYVYYLKAPAVPEDAAEADTYHILAGGEYEYAYKPPEASETWTFTWGDDQVLVKPEVTRAMMEAIQPTGSIAPPKLTFTAYAVQRDGFDTAEAAWEEAKKKAAE